MLGNTRLPLVTSTSIEDLTATINLKIPEDLAYFEGHFTDMPVVPGVVQIHWVIAFAKDLFELNLAINKGSQIKFMTLMQPNHTPTLTLTHNSEKSILSYKYHQNDTTYSSGKLSYEL